MTGDKSTKERLEDLREHLAHCDGENCERRTLDELIAITSTVEGSRLFWGEV